MAIYELVVSHYDAIGPVGYKTKTPPLAVRKFVNVLMSEKETKEWLEGLQNGGGDILEPWECPNACSGKHKINLVELEPGKIPLGKEIIKIVSGQKKKRR